MKGLIMYEKIVMYVLGFLVAYLVVKAIRSFRSVAIIAIMLTALCNMEANHSLLCSNASPNQIHCRWDRPNGNNVWNMNLAAGANSGEYVSGENGQNITLRIYYPTYPTLVATYSQTATNLIYTYVYSGPAQQYTNYCGVIAITNGNAYPESYTVTIYRTDTGAQVASAPITLEPFGSFYYEKCLPYPWRYEAQKLFLGTDEMPPVPQMGTNSTPTVSTNSPVNPTPYPSPGEPDITRDPIDESVARYTNANPNELSSQRQNTLALIAQLERIRIEAVSIRENQTNSSSQIDYRPYWTNLHNQMVQLTNNTRGLDSNTVYNTFADNYMSESNAAATDVDNYWNMSGLTNFGHSTWAGTITNVDQPAAADLRFSLGFVGGVEHLIKFDIADWSDKWLVQDCWQITGWASKWLAWAINLGLWLAIMYRIDWLVAESEQLIVSRVKPDSGGNWFGWIGKLGIKLLLTSAIVGLLIMVPTTLITWLYTNNVTNPLTAATPAQEVANNTMAVGTLMAKFVRHWWNQLIHVIPYVTVISALVTWVAFYTYSRQIAQIVTRVAWRWGTLMPIGFLLITVNTEATELRFENLTANDIVVSNNTVQMTFKPGQTVINQIEPGNWSCGLDNFTIADDGCQVVRITQNKNTGQGVWESGAELSNVDCFLYGMGSGFGIFGSAWAVSAMWWGWKMRHGGE